jgi:diguanylate cyclase (GGDEF)-like protein
MSEGHSSRRAAENRTRLNPVVFALASLVTAAILLSIVAVPQWLSRQARWEMLRAHVGEVGRLAASVVDGDLHRTLLDPGNYSKELYDRALEPLVRFHSADPDIFYVYTMAERDGVPHFVLDTSASPDLQTRHDLEASGYMEPFELDEDDDRQWLKDLAAGKIYVSSDFETDDYGEFLTAHVPIEDSQGRYSGFVGVDFDTAYYLKQEGRFRAIAIGTLGVALLLALFIGYLVTLYHGSVRRRMDELYDSAIRDGLTGLLNRRGTMERLRPALEKHTGESALLLVDIDNLKMINDLRGHSTGDAVVAYVAEAIRQVVADGDRCARFGGDEFMIFAPDCNAEGATAIAKTILAKLSRQGMSLAGISFRVSIGIAVHEGKGAEFARLYREAGAALQDARMGGAGRVGVFDESTTTHLPPGARLERTS